VVSDMARALLLTREIEVPRSKYLVIQRQNAMYRPRSSIRVVKIYKVVLLVASQIVVPPKWLSDGPHSVG
jgi:hypothetical protein